MPCAKSAPEIGELEQGVWQLIELNLNPVENSEITLKFDANEKMVYGTAHCNNFFAGYTLFDAKGTKPNIEFKNIGSTKKMCPDTKQEEEFLAILPAIERVKLEGENLLLIDTLNQMRAVMVKMK